MDQSTKIVVRCSPGVCASVPVLVFSCRKWLMLVPPTSLLWLRLSRPGAGGRGDCQAAGHGADRRDAHQHGNVGAADVQPGHLLLQCVTAPHPAAAAQPGGVGSG